MTNELEKLKAENKIFKETLDELFKVQYQLADNNKKLRQCLTEIKNIAETCKCHNIDGCYTCKYFDDCQVEDAEIPTRDVCKVILQKISECEE